MIHLGLYEISEIIIGILFWWIGIYFLSRNPYTSLSWLVFGLLGAFGFLIFTDPIYTNARTIEEYIKWQKILDWPLFFAPIFYFHISLLFKIKQNKFQKSLLVIGYLGAVIFYILDIIGNNIINTKIIRISDLKYNYIFAPGVLLWPAVIFETGLVVIAIYNFFLETKKNFSKYFLVILGGIFYILSGALLGVSYYNFIPYSVVYFNVGISIATLLITYSIVRYHLFAPSEKIIFGKDFAYLTLGMFLLISIYLGAMFTSGLILDFPLLIFLTFLLILIFTTHSFYDWLTTFVRDIVYNLSYGLSVVNDGEVYQALKNYNRPERLEKSTLLRLNLINQKTQHGEEKTPVDALRKTVQEAIEYFEPEQDRERRTKRNLKYQLLKMIAFDQAEEGQILWELGFEEYPIRIMSKEGEARPPLFKAVAPSDYNYTSRNAYLALKKEAIHDTTWRISYLEKLSKKKII